jgi:hypothetical protein
VPTLGPLSMGGRANGAAVSFHELGG